MGVGGNAPLADFSNLFKAMLLQSTVENNSRQNASGRNRTSYAKRHRVTACSLTIRDHSLIKVLVGGVEPPTSCLSGKRSNH